MKNRNLIIALFLTITIVLSFSLVYVLNSHIDQNKNLVKNMLEKEAYAHFNTIISTRHWNASYGGVYVKQKEGIKPNPYLEDNHEYTKDGSLLIKINPAWMTRQISEISNQTNKNFFKITSLNPLNPGNVPDAFENKALKYLEENENKNYYFEISKNKESFDFLGSLKVQKSCLECHAKQGYKIGDVRGGIRISVPTTEYFKKLEHVEEEHTYLTIIIFASAIIIITLLIWFINRFFLHQITIEKNLKEIKALKKVNDEFLLRYEYAIDGTKDGLWDWNLKTNEIFFSKRWKSMLGFNEDELEDDLNTWEQRVHPDDKKQAIKDIEDNHKKITDYYQNIHRLKHKDGSWVWILDRGKTYFNEQGEAIRMVGFHSNITELKDLEVKLKETEHELSQLKMVIESAPIGIVITDIEANISYVNERYCELSGYSKDELIGENPKKLKFEDDIEFETYENLWQSISDEKSWGGIFRSRKKDGSEYWETATIVPIVNSENQVINYLGIMKEITKEVYLEKQVHEKEELMLSQSKNAAMGEMISMIAHQWRQPITAISMNANNIIADIDLDMFEKEQIKDVANEISSQTQFLSKTIDDFRNFFKADKEIEVVNIKSLFDELSSIIIASLKNNDIEFRANYDETISVNTYKRELLQVLLNIVKNAKEALTEKHIEKRYIEVSVKESKKGVKIYISDNAGGIKEENLKKIFEAYFTTKEQYNGTGLGLYMSRIIVEKHLNGKLNVYNNEEGAVFTIKLKNL